MRKLIIGFVFLTFHSLASPQKLDPGLIGSDQQLCYSSKPIALTQIPASGGTPTYRYQWQRSNDNGNTWINIKYAQKVTYSIPLLVKTALFRRRVTDAASRIKYSSNVNDTSVHYITISVWPKLIAGVIGTAQTINAGIAPTALSELPGKAASGGIGSYTYQWQNSTDGLYWSGIQGATSAVYAPPVLTADTWYRRLVVDASCGSTSSNSVKITVIPGITLAQLHDNKTINKNTSTTFNVAISGGISPYIINYTRNGLAQDPVTGYISGTDISTGVLSAGLYTYALTSVTDANANTAPSLGTSIAITVTSNETIFTNEIPAHSDHDNHYDMGTKFKILTNGFISKVRLYTHLLEGGKHEIRIWKDNGSDIYTLMPGFPIDWSFSPGTEGWREYELVNPVAVESNVKYIVSITTGEDNNWYVQTNWFVPVVPNINIQYLLGWGYFTLNVGEVPDRTYADAAYYRDIVFVSFYPGSVGVSQSICYNTVPAALTELSAPIGGSEPYSFQWQSSPDNLNWTDIPTAISPGYSPPALTVSTYYRRKVTSGTYTAESTPLLITVYAPITLAQLHDDITIYNNTSTNFNIVISGGTSPYTVNYTRNLIPQTPITDYTSGNDISTGVLTNDPTGTYVYALTSVTDANGCNALSLGTNITVTVSGSYTPPARTNKALVIVNDASVNFPDYSTYIKPYIENFGIPYDEYNEHSPAGLPELSNYSVIIFGHKNVYDGVTNLYPINALESAINTGGVGLYSFDPHLFDYPSSFSTVLATPLTSESNQINVLTNQNPTHYITKYHVNDNYENYVQYPPHSQQNNPVSLLTNITITRRSVLVNGSDLAMVSSLPVLEASSYGSGRIVKWNGYDWVFDNVLGPVYGMDDLIWRGIVWAARKPFAMQGMPPMITMRVDDVDGIGEGVQNNFEWITISNEFGFIPWCGTFNDNIPSGSIGTLRSLINSNLTTASPHAFSEEEYIYFNHGDQDPFFYPADNVIRAKNYYISNGLAMSKFVVPHYYEISSLALGEMHNMGIEFLGTHILPDNMYHGSTWLNCGPYRINRSGNVDDSKPVYYGAKVNWGGYDFFNCVTEIRDDLSYEWFPTLDVASTIAAGIRQLRRSLNSMVLTTLFTHEYYINLETADWREILGTIASEISSYNPEFRSMDYALQYIRAKSNINIANITVDENLVNITYSGVNDMDTRCYLFNESGNQISYRLITLPQISTGSITVSVLK